jgi:hypothetical protein
VVLIWLTPITAESASYNLIHDYSLYKIKPKIKRIASESAIESERLRPLKTHRIHRSRNSFINILMG